jgi:hypothetical protein
VTDADCDRWVTRLRWVAVPVLAAAWAAVVLYKLAPEGPAVTRALPLNEFGRFMAWFVVLHWAFATLAALGCTVRIMLWRLHRV